MTQDSKPETYTKKKSKKNTAAKDAFFVIAKERVVDRAVGNKRSREEKLNAFGIP